MRRSGPVRWRAFLFAAVVALVGVPLASPAAAEEPVRVMPLGDSLTDGWNYYPGGYRIELDRLLRADGHTGFDFVGSLQNGPLADKDHEGHSGWTIDQIRPNIVTYLDTQDPDVVLLMLGTNNTKTAYWGSAEGTAAKLADLVDAILAHPSSPDVLVASIPPIPGDPERDARARQYNALIPSVVDPRKSQGVSFVNVQSRFLNRDGSIKTALYGIDGIHPVKAGYDAIGSEFRNGLAPIFPK